MSFLTAGTKASNSRLWKQIQQLINQDRHKEFKILCETNPQLPLVLLDSRISTRTRLDGCLTDRFGLSATDLNALEITLLQHRHDLFAYPILVCLKRHATPAQLKIFLNHVFSKGNTCLYLAVFRGHLRLVKLMLDLGADPCSKNNLQESPIDYCTLSDISRLLEPVKTSSILLKKAMVMMAPTSSQPPHLVPSDHFPKPSASPLSFSSSSSSSSSSFSIDLWTPSPVIKEVDEDMFSLQQGIGALDIFPQRTLPPRSMPRKKTMRKNNIREEEEEEKETTKDLFRKASLSPRKALPKDIQRQKKQVQFDPRIILIDSCVRGDQEELKEWMTDDMSEICDSQNRSLLHIALMHGNEHLVEDLIDKVDINQTDLDGWTCLHYTAAMGLWKSLAKLASLSHINLHEM
ncbi:hypothetical protein G6F56_011165 [Rhizopus delemar]|nr:hypothetical protein G6F56_011165 [Rhizopus delemar]